METLGFNKNRDEGIAIARRAVDADMAGNYAAAIEDYGKATHELIAGLKDEKNPATQDKMREKCSEYVARMETLAAAEPFRSDPIITGFVERILRAASGQALLHAAASGSVEKVRQLLARGADKDTRDTGGRTSLMLAAQHGCTDIVLALVDGGADKALMDQLGRTALRHARLGKHELLVEFLANGASDA